MTFLEYKNSQFYECSGAPTTEISLNIDDSLKKLILSVSGGTSMNQKRSAERNARGISKAGFRSDSGATLGRGYELVVEGHGGGLPTA